MSERRDREGERDPALDEVEKLLDQAAAAEASAMREAEALSSAPGLDDVERTLAGAWGETRGPRRGPFALFAVLSLAAAAVLLFLILKPEPKPTPGPSGEYLNQGTKELRWTRGATPGSHAIDWTGVRGSGFRVKVLHPESGDALLAPDTIVGTKLEVPGDVSAAWPESVEIEVQFRAPDGELKRLRATIEPGR